MIRGLTLGGYNPLHVGHELLIDMAMANCDQLFILVGYTDDDKIPVLTRVGWLRDFRNKRGWDAAKFQIIRDYDPLPNGETDEDGTRTDARFWHQWLATHKTLFESIDRVFTSDPYGQVIADRIDAKWFPVDPDRELVPISSTDIREGSPGGWGYISDVAKPDLSTVVSIVGAESTGKSTLTKKLAEFFGTTYAPEYGRILSEVRVNDLDEDDFNAIARTQAVMIRKAVITSRRNLCFTDTEAITTQLFAPIFLQHVADLEIDHIILRQKIDLFLVLAPTVKRVQDGTRVLDEAQRWEFHTKLLARLHAMGATYEIIEHEEYNRRFLHAREFVRSHMQANRKY